MSSFFPLKSWLRRRLPSRRAAGPAVSAGFAPIASDRDAPLAAERRGGLPAAAVSYGLSFGLDIPYPALVRGWLHSRTWEGTWDAARLVASLGGHAWSSVHAPSDRFAMTGQRARHSALQRLSGFGPRGGFIELGAVSESEMEDAPRYSLRLHAATAEQADTLLARTREEFLAPPPAVADQPRIALLNSGFDSFDILRVRVAEEQRVDRADVDLFYGDGTGEWLDDWIERFHRRRYGLSILSGAPGTGKTTLLRSLAAWLSPTHLFYFIPASRFASVDAGEAVSFFARQNRISALNKVLVLEDGESVLHRRAEDNRERVATLLNLTDGIMGDALGLQVICTLNSDVKDLDPALLRPGRLLTHRVFDRLPKAAALRLAVHLGRAAPPGATVSLAEFFNPNDLGRETDAHSRRTVGFQVGQTSA